MAAECFDACKFYTHCESVANSTPVPDSQQGTLRQSGPHGRTRVYAAKVVVHEMTGAECPAPQPNVAAECAALAIAAQAQTEAAMGYNRFA